MRGLEFFESLADRAPEQLYRYALDWRFQKDKGYQAVVEWEEREPGSIESVLNAYAKVIPWIRNKKELTVDDLKRIHEVCSAHQEDKLIRGEFRIGLATFRISKYNSTEEGMRRFIEEDLVEHSNPNKIPRLLIAQKATQAFRASNKDPYALFNHLCDIRAIEFTGYLGDLKPAELMLLEDINQLIYNQVLNEILDEDTNLREIFLRKDKKKLLIDRVLELPDAIELLDKHNYDGIVTPESLEKYRTTMNRLQKALNDEVQQALVAFYEKINSSTPLSSEEKLYAIASLIQHLEQIHPFNDVNCRTFCMIFLNILLMQNDFLPALIDDPNKFDGYDLDSLVSIIKEGIQRSETLQSYSHSRPKKNLMLFSHQSTPSWCDVPKDKKNSVIKMASQLKKALIGPSNAQYSCTIS